MGERTITHYVRSEDVDGIAAALAPPLAVVGRQGDWVALSDSLDSAQGASELSARFGTTVVTAYFADDFGLALHLATNGEAQGEVSLDGIEEPGEEDRRFLASAVAAGLFPSDGVEAVLAHFSDRDWIAEHGVEATLGLTSGTSATVPKRRPSATRKSKQVPARVATPAEVDRVIDLHAHYVAHVFSLNVWTLFNRYKKALPAMRRNEIESLIGLVVEGASESEIRAVLAPLLRDIWSAEDWDRLIRDPKLIDTDDEEVVARWQALLGS